MKPKIKPLSRVGLILIALISFYSCNIANEENTIPVANPGTSQSVKAGTLIQLNGNGSSDADNDALTYLWSITTAPAGSTATLSSTTIVNPTLTPTLAGTYIISLIVNDGTTDSASSQVTLTIKDFIGFFSRSFVESGETNGLVPVGTNMKETNEVFIGNGSTLDYNSDNVVDITYELNTIYIISTTYTVNNSVDSILWKSIIKCVQPSDLSDATLLVVNAMGGWHTNRW